MTGGKTTRRATRSTRSAPRAPARRARKNPALVMLANPRTPKGAVLLSAHVLSVRYVHAEDGKTYQHDFRPGVRAELLPNGTVRLTQVKGRPLWGNF